MTTTKYILHSVTKNKLQRMRSVLAEYSSDVAWMGVLSNQQNFRRDMLNVESLLDQARQILFDAEN